MLFVSFFHNKHKSVDRDSQPDLIKEYLGDGDVSPLIPVIMTILVIYVLLSSDKTTGCTLESIFIMFVCTLVVKTFQNIANPKSNGKIAYRLPLTCIVLLTSYSSGIIPKSYLKHVYMYIVASAAVELKTNSDINTTTIVNDIILSHVMFYLNK